MKKSKQPTHLIVHWPDYDILTPEQKAEYDRRMHKVYEVFVSKVPADNQQATKHIPVTKKSKVTHVFEMANELEVKVPKSIYKLPFIDVWTIEWELECEMSDRETLEQYNTIVSYDPPRPPVEERIAKRIARAKLTIK